MGRNPRGSIAVINVGGRLKLQFPRKWNEGKQKYRALDLPDTPDNRAYAAGLVREMEWDYLRGQFDRSLAKYFQTEETSTELTIADLWSEFCVYKSRSLKAASIFYMTSTLGVHIQRCPHQSISDALAVREWLLSNTTPAMARKVIAALATAFKWGIRHQKISTAANPFLGMSDDIRVDRDLPPPNAFTQGEQSAILEAFAHNRYYAHYRHFVRFLLLTGCRPSEAIGLEWEQITSDYSLIRFDRSIARVGGKVVKNAKSKTNRVRIFPANEELQSFLSQLAQSRQSNQRLVFLSPTDKPIDYENFSRRAWSKVVEPTIGRRSTPYSCRDSFITHQIGSGVPVAVIAKWVDNSVKMIETRYLDPTALDRFKPL